MYSVRTTLLTSVSLKAILFFWKEKGIAHKLQEGTMFYDFIQAQASNSEEDFFKLFAKKTLFVALIERSCIPEAFRSDMDPDQKYAYVLLDMRGRSVGKFLRSQDAFRSARVEGYKPQWSH